MEFELPESFVDQYKDVDPGFGFNGLGEIVYYRSYAREKEDGTKEDWWETCRRVVEGTYSIQKRHIQRYGLGWSDSKGQKSAQEMYDRMFHMKFLPPGRGLWAMGSPITEEKDLYAALNNCSYVSTEDMVEDPSKPFCFLMDMSMLGVGVGFDTKGEGCIPISKPTGAHMLYTIPDTREGWVESLRLLLGSYLTKNQLIVSFDYDKIRPAGEPIKTFGGVASGPGPLIELHDAIRDMLDRRDGVPITGRVITDIMNMIGKCVVSGNVRRSAEIALGPADEWFMELKDYDEHPERAGFGWASNNSVFATLGMDYSDAARRTARNGEPGYFWLDNARAYSRMGDDPDYKDIRVKGVNPCGEQSLESYEVCNLVETFPARHDNKRDYLRTLKFAYLYSKTVTLCNTHWTDTNKVLLRNRRIGCSVSGVAQFLSQEGIHELRYWLNEGYDVVNRWDRVYSDWLAVPRSIKTTSVKPSGSVSLLAGATPGMHYPESRFYTRRVRIAKGSPMVDKLKQGGYVVEDAIGDDSAVVVEVPVDAGEGVRGVDDVSIWEQLSLAATLQEVWSDNQVSCTVTMPQDTLPEEVENALNYFQYKLKSVSFLPKASGHYEQMPYEEITKDEYNEAVARITPIKLSGTQGIETETEKFCDSDVCLI